MSKHYFRIVKFSGNLYDKYKKLLGVLMSLRYIFGGSGSGKTTKCLDEIFQLAQSAQHKLYYIVPEQYSLEAEKKLVARFPGKSTVKAQVLSFERLAFHVLSETGTKQGDILDHMGKNMIVRKILNDVKPRLKYYKNAAVSFGLVKNISGSIKEFYQYKIKPEDINTPENITIGQKYKFEDIRLIYNEYKNFVENDFISGDTTLDLLCDNIEKSGLINNSIIWIDNFTGFTPQEYNVIGQFLKLAHTVNICINTKEKALQHNDLTLDDPYYESKYLINKLTQIAGEANIAIDPICFMENSFRFSASPEIRWIEQHYNDAVLPVYPHVNERVIIKSPGNKYDEIHDLAGEITRLVRDEGLLYSQIAVLSGNIDSYAPSIQNIFSRYNIPSFIDTRIGILAHPLVEFIRGLFEIRLKNWSYESVFRLLKTNLLPIGFDDIDLLENYVIAYGIKGWKWKNVEWKYGFSERGSYDREKIHEIKSIIYESISPFSENIGEKGVVNPEKLCRQIYEYLVNIGIEQKLNELSIEAAHSKNMQLYREHAGIWNTVMKVLDKIVSIFGNTPMSVKEFAQILDAGFASCDMGILPPAQDQVIAGDIYRTRLNEIKALFVVGATEDSFPKKAEDEGVFNDKDKLILKSMDIELSFESDKQTYINSHLAYPVFTKASDYIYIYYPQSNINGKSLVPSPVVHKIRQLFNEHNTQSKAQITLPGVMLKDLGNILTKKKEGISLNEFETALYDWYTENKAFSSHITKAQLESYNIKPLSKNVLSDLYKDNIRISISRLEKYVECPFSYFVRYNLKAAERDSYQVQNVDLGNVFHDVLEHFSRDLECSGLNWGELEFGEIESKVNAIFETIIQDDTTDIFTYDIKSAYILERVKKTAIRSIWALGKHISKGNFTPYGAEVDFGITSPVSGIKIEIDDNHSFTLTGRIDRIDLLDKNGEKYVKIIDYKSGDKKFDITDIYYGMQMQLLVYMGALLKRGDQILSLDKKPQPGGIFYFRLNDPVIDYKKASASSDIYNKLLEEFKMSGLVLNEKDVIEGIDNNVGKSSAVLPVYVKSTGEYGTKSNALASSEDFNSIIEYTSKKIQNIGKDIVSGNIDAKPYKKGTRTGCEFCNFASICGFDRNSSQSAYRLFNSKKSISDLK